MTTGATSRAGFAYPSGTPWLSLFLMVFVFLCVVLCRLLFVLIVIFLLAMYRLSFFDLQFLITPFSNVSPILL